jgi:hypothetical protein
MLGLEDAERAWRPAWFPDNASNKRAIPLPRVHIRVTHRSTRHIGLHPCELLSLDVRVAERYLDCSGFGHARLGCWSEFGPLNNKLDHLQPIASTSGAHDDL